MLRRSFAHVFLILLVASTAWAADAPKEKPKDSTRVAKPVGEEPPITILSAAIQPMQRYETHVEIYENGTHSPASERHGEPALALKLRANMPIVELEFEVKRFDKSGKDVDETISQVTADPGYYLHCRQKAFAKGELITEEWGLPKEKQIAKIKGRLVRIRLARNGNDRDGGDALDLPKDKPITFEAKTKDLPQKK